MKLIDFSRQHAEPIERYESLSAWSVPLGDGVGEAHVYCLYFGPGGQIGEHPTGFTQLFLVMQGEGWAAGADGRRVALSAGQGVFFERGELHTKGSDTGMTVIMVQVDHLKPREVQDLPLGVIAPFRWDKRRIPISGEAEPGMEGIDRAVTSAMRKYGVVGCGVCLVHNARIVYSRGFGYAELPHTPFLTTTATRCGSIAKPITALSALLLADQGKLDLDARILPILKTMGIVSKPVGSARMDSRVSKITVRHLMDHTSGLPQGATYTAWRPNRNVAEQHQLDHIATSSDVACDALGNSRLDSEPGAKYQYANANFVLLARVIEARSRMPFSEFLTRVVLPRFGLSAEDVYVSRNQERPDSPARGKNEAAYYQTSSERYVSFVPSELSRGQTYGEAYHGYATEASDGAGGIACTAVGVAKIIANLHSATPAISHSALQEILTPPPHYTSEPGFDPTHSNYYSKGFNMRYSGGQPWFAHGGMTNHCGGIVGHNAGYQYIAVSNWNHTGQPYVATILDNALGKAIARLGG